MEHRLAKKISEIARSLGVTSEDIIAKCLAEGVPQDTVKDHMSLIGPGLEASIRGWFAQDDREDPPALPVPA